MGSYKLPETLACEITFRPRVDHIVHGVCIWTTSSDTHNDVEK